MHSRTRWLALLGHLPLSDYHPNAPVTIDQVAALVSAFATHPHQRLGPTAKARPAADHAYVGVQVMWRLVRHVVCPEPGEGAVAGGGALQCVVFEELISCLGVDVASLDDVSRDMAGGVGGKEGESNGGVSVSRMLHEAQALWMLQAFVRGLRGVIEGLSPGDAPPQLISQAQAMLDMIRRAVLPLLVCRGCQSEVQGPEEQGWQGASLCVLIVHGAARVLVAAGAGAANDGARLCPENKDVPTYLCATASKALRQCRAGLTLEQAVVCMYRCYGLLSVYVSWYLRRACTGGGGDGNVEAHGGGVGGGTGVDALREVLELLVDIVDEHCRLVLGGASCAECGPAVKMLRLGLQTLLRVLCPDLNGDVSRAPAEGEDAAMPQDLMEMIASRHLQGSLKHMALPWSACPSAAATGSMRSPSHTNAEGWTSCI